MPVQLISAPTARLVTHLIPARGLVDVVSHAGSGLIDAVGRDSQGRPSDGGRQMHVSVNDASDLAWLSESCLNSRPAPKCL